MTGVLVDSAAVVMHWAATVSYTHLDVYKRQGQPMSIALLPVTLSMLCAGMAGIFLVLGVLVLGVYALNKFFSGK